MEKKQVTFSQEAPLIKQYSNDFSTYRKANSQTPQEYYLAKKEHKEEKQKKRIQKYKDKREKIADDNRFAYWYLGGRKSKKRKSIKKPRKIKKTRKIRK